MDENLLLLLAFDSLLLELDDDYEGVTQEQNELIHSKVLESYGLTVSSSKEEIAKLKELMIQDVKKYREKLIKNIG